MDPLAASGYGDALSTGRDALGMGRDALGTGAGRDTLAVPAGPDPTAPTTWADPPASGGGTDPLAVPAGPDPLAVAYAAGALVAADEVAADPLTGYADATLSGGRQIAQPVPPLAAAPPPVVRPAPAAAPGPAPGRPGHRQQPAGPVSWNDLTIRGRAPAPPGAGGRRGGTPPAPGRPAGSHEWARRSGGVPRPAFPRPTGGVRPADRGWSGGTPPNQVRPGPTGSGSGWDSYVTGTPGRHARRENPWPPGQQPTASAVVRALFRMLRG